MKYRNIHTGAVFVVTEVKPNTAPGMNFHLGYYEGDAPKVGNQRTMIAEHELNAHWKQI